MKELNNIVVNYLAKENVQYAILINGSWGSGKTYYWKNELEQLIKSTNVPGRETGSVDTGTVELKYRPLYISLFGVKTIEDLNKKLFFEVCNQLKFFQSNTAKVMGEAAKSLLGLVDPFGVFGKIAQKVTEADIDYSKLLDFNDCVLCFDDLERASMEIDELLGYINNLVEHDKVKTIIIANEEEIVKLTKNIELKLQCAVQAVPEKERTIDNIHEKMGELFQNNSRFAVIKEKTIGITVDYVPEMDLILPKLILETSTDETMRAILNDNIPLVKETVKKSKLGLNLRVIKYAISDFVIVCQYLKEKHSSMLSALSKPLLKFILAASLEFKANKSAERLDKQTLLDMGNTETSFYYQSIFKNKEDIVTKFVQKYFGEDMNEILVLDTVTRLIATGHFDGDKFDEEIKRLTPSEQSSTDKILNGYWTLTDVEFKLAIDDVINKIDNGEYSLAMYLKLYRNIEYFCQKGLVNLSIAVLQKKFMDGMDKSFNNSSYTPTLKFDSFVDGELSDESKQIRAYAGTLNERLGIKELADEINSLINDMPNKLDEFCFKLGSSNSEMWSKPVFKYMVISQLVDKITMMENKQIIALRNCIEERYRAINIHETDLVNDYENLLVLKDCLEDHIKQQQISLSTHLKRVLVKTLEDVTSKLRPRS